MEAAGWTYLREPTSSQDSESSASSPTPLSEDENDELESERDELEHPPSTVLSKRKVPLRLKKSATTPRKKQKLLHQQRHSLTPTRPPPCSKASQHKKHVRSSVSDSETPTALGLALASTVPSTPVEKQPRPKPRPRMKVPPPIIELLSTSEDERKPGPRSNSVISLSSDDDNTLPVPHKPTLFIRTRTLEDGTCMILDSDDEAPPSSIPSSTTTLRPTTPSPPPIPSSSVTVRNQPSSLSSSPATYNPHQSSLSPLTSLSPDSPLSPCPTLQEIIAQEHKQIAAQAPEIPPNHRTTSPVPMLPLSLSWGRKHKHQQKEKIMSTDDIWHHLSPSDSSSVSSIS